MFKISQFFMLKHFMIYLYDHLRVFNKSRTKCEDNARRQCLFWSTSLLNTLHNNCGTIHTPAQPHSVCIVALAPSPAEVMSTALAASKPISLGYWTTYIKSGKYTWADYISYWSSYSHCTSTELNSQNIIIPGLWCSKFLLILSSYTNELIYFIEYALGLENFLKMVGPLYTFKVFVIRKRL